MANEERRQARSNEYTLPPGTYIYVQDGTGGKIKTYVGPTVVTLTGNDSPIVYDDGDKEFKRCDTLEAALKKSKVVPDGFYAVLMNPARGGANPIDGEVKPSPDLDVGNKIVVNGPKMFALWPGQTAQVIRGHHLRSNQFLLCRVYNEVEARKNWSSAKMVKAAPAGAEQSDAGQQGQAQAPGTSGAVQAAPQPQQASSDSIMENLRVGQMIVVKGTDYSFFIPPTGITVMGEEELDESGNPTGEMVYVRSAVTLEQLQYCILLDEDGNKRYVRGPAVVFPEPTEKFVANATGGVVFMAIVLNEIQGIHVKVTKAYKDEVLGDLKEGQEVFITGKQYPIYYKREEHQFVSYDGKVKQFAVTIPEGEGRYLLHRLTGQIELVRGPRMLLPDSSTEVIVRRVLSDKECALWYPGNVDALAVNRNLRELSKNVPTTRGGAVSEGDIERGTKGKRGAGMSPLLRASSLAPSHFGDEAAFMNYAAPAAAMPVPTTKSISTSNSLVSSQNVDTTPSDEIARSSTFTTPRTVQFDNKYEGVPRISVWTGFAVMVVNTKGDRRVEVGPKNLLLQYDEVLESMSLSTGKPKTTDKLIETPYLRVKNNKVADIIDIETQDNVVLSLKLSYLVDFEGEPTKWWDVENYVKFLCDHMRSLLKAAAKDVGIEKLYGNPLPFVKSVVLGADGQGTTFDENGMVVSDVEVLDATLKDGEVANLLKTTQKSTVTRSIQVADKKRELEATKLLEGLKAEGAQVVYETQSKAREIEKRVLEEQGALALARIMNSITETQKQQALKAEQERLNSISFDAGLSRSRAETEQEEALAKIEQARMLEKLAAETEAQVKRLGALGTGFTEALLSLSSNETLVKVAQAMSAQKMFGGENVVDVIGNMFKDTALDKVMQSIASRAGGLSNGANGGAKHLTEAAPKA